MAYPKDVKVYSKDDKVVIHIIGDGSRKMEVEEAKVFIKWITDSIQEIELDREIDLERVLRLSIGRSK